VSVYAPEKLSEGLLLLYGHELYGHEARPGVLFCINDAGDTVLKISMEETH